MDDRIFEQQNPWQTWFEPHPSSATPISPAVTTRPAGITPPVGISVEPMIYDFAADVLLSEPVLAPHAQALPLPGCFLIEGGLRLSCLTPRHYLLHGQSRPSATQLDHWFGADAQLIEQTGARAHLLVSGPQRRACLRLGIPLDLDPLIFSKGMFAASFAGHVPIHLTALSAQQDELSCPLSMTGSFWHWLHQTAVPFGLEIKTTHIKG